MERKINFVVKLQRPVCRTPIKPLQKHKIVVKYIRKPKHIKQGLEND
jgi:hypothetical protein